MNKLNVEMKINKEWLFYIPSLKYKPQIVNFTYLKNIVESVKNLIHPIFLLFELIGSLKLIKIVKLRIQEQNPDITKRIIRRMLNLIKTIFTNNKPYYK